MRKGESQTVLLVYWCHLHKPRQQKLAALCHTDDPGRVHRFEGCEKKLWLWFGVARAVARTSEALQYSIGGHADLRTTISPQQWATLVLPLAGCTIVTHRIHGDPSQVHSYVLSESSLFVYKRVILLKTCGRTTLLRCLPALLELVSSATHGMLRLAGLCFSRSDYLFPLEQPQDHQTWDAEMKLLRMSWTKITCHSRDPWKLALVAAATETEYLVSSPCPCPTARFDLDLCSLPAQQLQENRKHGLDTPNNWLILEIAMYHLPAEAMQPFYWNKDQDCWNEEQDCRSQDQDCMSQDQDGLREHACFGGNGKQCFERSGLSKLFSWNDFDLVGHVFQPCGYSCNGVRLNSGGAEHLSVHVTPEPDQTFLSIEVGWCADTRTTTTSTCDCTIREALDLAQRAVCLVFRPSQCAVALMYGPGQAAVFGEGGVVLQFIETLQQRGWSTVQMEEACHSTGGASIQTWSKRFLRCSQL